MKGMKGIKGFQSTQTLEERFWSKVNKDGPLIVDTPCWEWTACRVPPRGYGDFGKDGRAHRVSYELAYGPIPDGLWVLHRCDNPPCVRPTHLFLGTHSDNMVDMYQKERDNKPRGEKHRWAKLTADDVLEIRVRYAAGGTSKAAISRSYHVDPTTIAAIIKGRTWRRA